MSYDIAVNKIISIDLEKIKFYINPKKTIVVKKLIYRIAYMILIFKIFNENKKLIFCDSKNLKIYEIK